MAPVPASPALPVTPPASIPALPTLPGAPARPNQPVNPESLVPDMPDFDSVSEYSASILDDALFEVVFRQSPTPIVITDADFSLGGPLIVKANPAFCAMTGYPENELIGVSPRILQGPETHRDVIDDLRKALREQRSSAGFTINYRRDGSPYWVDWTITPIFDRTGVVTHWMSVQQNVTEGVEAERLRDMLIQALNLAGDCVMVTSPGNRIVFVNAAFERLTGYTFEEIEGLSPDFLYEAGGNDESFIAAREAVASGSALRVRANLSTKDRTPFHAKHSLVPIKEDNGYISSYVSVFADISDLVHQARELTELAQTDKLTGLLNRHAGEARLSEAYDQWVDHGTICSIIICDIDHFKKVNDTYGHPAGDRIIKTVAEVMRAAARASDYIVRWGGEEFLIVLPQAPQHRASEVAERIRTTFAEQIDPEVGSKTMSFGVTQIVHNDTIDSLVERADQALYRAKEGGRNRVVVSDALALEDIPQINNI